MVQGTGSSVGKSTLVAGLARALTRRGLRVLPFKPQNMSNNAAVTLDGGEIGRAQALQARACGVPPMADMNPVLLKPQGETGAQLVVRGQRVDTVEARTYQSRKERLMPQVLQSFKNLAAQADIVLVEGAGSASEVNLRRHDIANMGFACATGAPVVLVGDIDRGGVIASLVGTQVVLAEGDAQRIKGFVVNRMRGDPTLFADGMRFVAEKTGWQALGLVPYLADVHDLPAEDAADLLTTLRARRHEGAGGTPRLRIAVPILPMVANFDDLDPLCTEPGVEVIPVLQGEPLPQADVVLLPGSKATLADLACLRARGWAEQIVQHAQNGGAVMGICGGYQMLGVSVADPSGTEGAPSTAQGLGLLPVHTSLGDSKRLEYVTGFLAQGGQAVAGYEMHLGQTDRPIGAEPLLRLNGQAEGCVSANGLVWGTYLHGVFTHRAARLALLERAGGAAFAPAGAWAQSGQALPASHDSTVEAALDRLADHLEQHMDVEALVALASLPVYAA
ncbi:MAG: cobyric acid synthase [Acetobacter sp.]